MSLKNVYCAAMFGLRHNLPWPRATHIYDEGWDLLIVLDACRPDLMAEVSRSFNFLPADFPTVWSTASESIGWLETQFQDRYRDEMIRTAYVVGNPFSDEYLDDSDFGILDEVWRYAWDNEVGGMPARPLTDRAVTLGREKAMDRVIVHYMQPHFPSFPRPLGSEQPLRKWGDDWESVWDELEADRIDRETVWNSYRANLSYVLDDIELLLSNFEADKVVITSDHGNAFGECGLYGHPQNYPAKALRQVPWITSQAHDSGGYEPVIQPDQFPSTNQTVDNRLRDLGYK